MCVGGAQLSLNTSHVIQKWTFNATLMKGHQAGPAHYSTINFIFYSEVAVHNILLYYFGTGDDNNWPGLIQAIQTVYTILQTGTCYKTVCVTVRG